MSLGAIKHIMYEAPTKARLLAYISLCCPIYEYADTVWDPFQRNQIETLENIQNRAFCFISMLRRRDSTSAARDELGLQTLEKRRRHHRLSLLCKIINDNNSHQDLSSDYDEVINSLAWSTMTTRSASRGELPSVHALFTI